MNQLWRRRLAHGSNATLVTVMVLAVLVLLYGLADRWRLRVDLSADAANTLQADTEAKLSLLDSDGVPVRITAFTFQRGKEDSALRDRAIRDLLVEIDHRSAVVEYRIVDFDRERLTAERLGVTDYGTVVIQRGDERIDLRDRELFRRKPRGGERSFDFLGESAISRAFAQLLAPTRRVAYVLQGHGEPSPDDRGPSGLSELVAALDLERYDVSGLDLVRTDREGRGPQVPEDAAFLIVAGATSALTSLEEDAILDYLGRGGSLLLALESGRPTPSFLPRLGLRLVEGLAMDTTLVFPFKDRPVPIYRDHEITRVVREADKVAVLGAPGPLRPVEPPPAGVRLSPLLVGGRDSWIERGGPEAGGQASFQPEIDGPGPTLLAAAVDLLPGGELVRRSRPPGRVLVIGDAEWLANGLLGEGPANRELALAVASWLAGDDARLQASVARRGQDRRLALSGVEMERIRQLSLLLLPGLVGLAGLWTGWRRRGR